MTTFRKLPTSRPNKKYPAIKSAGYSANKSLIETLSRISSPVLSDYGTDCEEWQIHCNHQAAHQDAEYRHDHRLQQGGQSIDHGIDGLFVMGGYFGEHLIQCTRFLTNSHHLSKHG